ncbi:hypothetical protein P168DRAFT_286703 [Aspergillus campestris IBT 28561]|uniref:Uncharacterized protein n=1 Tax=Aspergillus campestris (strain IBT 28561) TaxID=1392248 RepID=A0A2I1DFD8_ASPC2|nr:uncharacterized protein P168DRAFT_286703 [Aspergillus campestris IBT 28561]PKY08589.1 hypothetical protein P168DRAFT_286703 [Aspergillus campestris IBT 28561]
MPQDPEEHQVLQEWLSQRLLNYPSKSQPLQSIYASEITSLQAFVLNQTTPEEAAHAITRPISTTPIPDLPATYNPEIVALCRLLELLVDALLEWPSSRTPGLIALLTAMSNTPDGLHRGEALDDDDELLTWSQLPYINMVWRDTTWRTPSIIVEECAERGDTSATALHHAADQYIKAQDIEAQLVAAGLFDMSRPFHYVVHTLEWHLGTKDKPETQTMGFWVSEPFEPRFQVPAVAGWMKHTGRKLYEGLCGGEMENWNPRRIDTVMKHFDCPSERWAFWEEQLVGVARDWPDEVVRREAGRAVGYMRDVA